MAPLQDYVYRFSRDSMHMAGRCRVRIFAGANGARTVLLTELTHNPGESVASACDYIATELAARWGLNPRSTHWLLHESPTDELPQQFEELEFTWDDNRNATDPQWQRLIDAEAETLIGEALGPLNRRIGDSGSQAEGGR